MGSIDNETAAGTNHDIAIVGTACRVAGATSPDGLWESLMARRDVQSDTKSRFTGYYDREHGKSKGLTNVRNAYLIEEGIDRFDNEFFGIPPVEAAAIDPQQRLLLEVSYEALESAGMPLDRIRGTDTAVFAGIFTSDYGTSMLRDIDATPKYHSTGTSNSMAANRLSYFFDLHGPSMVIDTACSSTITALHQAINSIRSRESQVAIVCGANLILNPDMFVTMSELGFLSPRGRCHSFDASGDGYARGEGVLAMIIKPLEAAIAQNDPIRAIIKGTRLNQDGRTNGITLPSAEAQERNMKELYRQLNMNPNDVQYLEAHGTGTAVGDPIEMGAIERTFADPSRGTKLIVGSVKSNCGHLEACAALIGIIKTIECMERGLIPPQLHLNTPNPKINFTELHVPLEPTPWPVSPSGRRIAGVNSFGFGGANGHLVLEHRVPPQNGNVLTQPSIRPLLFRLSATTDTGLSRVRRDMAAFVESNNPCLRELSYTTLFRRSMLRKSHLYVASTADELSAKLKSGDPTTTLSVQDSSTETCRLSFVFTGQGAQWTGMGASLLDVCPAFTSAIDECDAELARLIDPPDWSLRGELLKLGDTSNVSRSRFSQPLCTAVQLGLIRFWTSLDIYPSSTVGHSSGEIAAAYCAGTITLKNAIIIAYYRGLHMSNAASATGASGAMAAVGMSSHASLDFLKRWTPRVDLAAINSPSSCTLSGDEDCIDEIVEACKEAGIFCRKLRVDTAFHSHHMTDCAEPYVGALVEAGVTPQASHASNSIIMYSSVTGKAVDALSLTPRYWAANMTSTVRFADALSQLARHQEPTAILEIGPHPALKGPAQETLAAVADVSSLEYLGSLSRGKNDFDALFSTYGTMLALRWVAEPASTYTLGLADPEGHRPRPLHDLPSYPWDHSSTHWAETRVSLAHRYRKHERDLLLGSRAPNDTTLSMCWRNTLSLAEIDWLRSNIHENRLALQPSLCFLLICEAARQIASDCSIVVTAFQFSDIAFARIPNDIMQWPPESVELQLHVQPTEDDSGNFSFRILIAAAGNQQRWLRACAGTMSLLREDLTNDPVIAAVDAHPETGILLDLLERKTPDSIANFVMSPTGAAGEFDAMLCPGTASGVDYELFDWMTGLLSTHLPIDETPSSYFLRTVESFRITADAPLQTRGQFVINTQRHDSGWNASNLTTDVDGVNLLQIKGALSERIGYLPLAPPLESLFYQPVWLPDLDFYAGHTVSADQMLQYLTHKWPMADIGIATVNRQLQLEIVARLQGSRTTDRPRFRSLVVEGASQRTFSDRVVFTDRFEPENLQLLVVDAEMLTSIESSLSAGGYVCILSTVRQRVVPKHPGFDYVCEVAVQTEGTYAVLLRKVPAQRQDTANPPKILSLDSTPWSNDLGYDVIELGSVSASTASQCGLDAPCDVVILDCSTTSMLCGRDPTDWLESLKVVVSQARCLLWISAGKKGVPYSGATSAFIRTLASEHPLMKAASLDVTGILTSHTFDNVVLPLLTSVRLGSKEVALKYENGGLSILRYLPDDELSAFTGAGAAVQRHQTSSSVNHKVALTRPGAVTVCPVRHFREPVRSEEHDEVAVDVVYSVVDHSDTHLLHSAKPDDVPLGRYFAGSLSPTQEQGPVNVVGCASGAHARKLIVPHDAVHKIPTGVPLDAALFAYVAYTTAVSILWESLRIRPGESVQITWSTPDALFFEKACHDLGCAVISEPNEAADFVLRRSTTGYLTNGMSIRLSTKPVAALKHGVLDALCSMILADTPHLEVYGLDRVQEAFDVVAASGVCATIDHTSAAVEPLLTIKKSPTNMLFHKRAVYVIVGGFGGLGRFLMSWMIEKGARHFAVISRSGSTSNNAQQAIADVESQGGRIHSIRADAGDALAVSEALNSIRLQMPIRGVLNMAIVLDNSPFMAMQPGQWNAGIRTKIDTTMSLHSATFEDQLDFFIMFSSVSSLSGNRAQSAYAAGNGFQNAMAAYRRSLGLPAVTIALGAMEGIGTLADDVNLLRILKQSGLRVLTKEDFILCMEAAVMESQHDDRPLIATGFDMFNSLDGTIQSRADQNQIFWAESAEFHHLFDHRSSGESRDTDASLLDKMNAAHGAAALDHLKQAFASFLAGVLGYPDKTLDLSMSMASYGVDSLNAVACRFWFHKELAIDVPVFDILGSKSIDDMLLKTRHRLEAQVSSESAVTLPQPRALDPAELHVRPLSHSQSRLWFLHNFLEDKTLYNLLLTCHVEGTINVALLRRAMAMFMERHDALRTCILETSRGWQQTVRSSPVEYPLQEVHCVSSAFREMEQMITKRARNHQFDPATGHLLHGWLLISPAGTRFFLASHHLAWDRGSVATIFDEVPTIYSNLHQGGDPYASLNAHPLQFIDYTIWQEQMLSIEAHTKPHIDYWKQQLADSPQSVSLLNLSKASRRPAVKTHKTCSTSLSLSPAIANLVKSFCAAHAATPFMFMTSMMGVLVHRLTGDTEIVIGVADGDRGHPAFDNMVGFTVNMLPIKARLSSDTTYPNILEDFRGVCLEAYEHGATPFDYLLQVLDIPRSTSHNPIFQIIVNYQSAGSFPTPDFKDFKFTSYDHYNAQTQTDLSLEIEETGRGGMDLLFEFDEALYDIQAAKQFATMFEMLVTQILNEADSYKPVGQLDLIPPEDLDFISDALRPEFAADLGELQADLLDNTFARAVSKSPHKPALVDKTHSITYSELNLTTDAVARHLLQSGVREQDRIGICCEPDIDMMVAIYGVLRARCVIVPLDPDFPAERMVAIAEDTDITTVITNSSTPSMCQKLIAAGVYDIRKVQDLSFDNIPDPAEPLATKIVPGDILCALFTSGSTGRPKGINIGHEQLRLQGEEYHRLLGTSQTDMMLLSSSIVFDMSLHPIFGTILHGGTLLIASREERYSAESMVDFIVQHQVSNCIFTPTQLKLILRAPNRDKLHSWTSLCSLTLGGEPVPTWVLREILALDLPRANLYNGYAPTECTIINSLRQCGREDAECEGFLPLALPLAPARFYILDEHRRETPLGVPGELWIGGPIVNNGYIKRPDLTEAAFVTNVLSGTPSGLLYRTGDSFSLDHTGTLRALGRIAGNRQIKIRGMRVELDEIESILYAALKLAAEHAELSVGLCAVVYYRRDGFNGWLAAFVESESIFRAAELQAELVRFLQLRLKANLPVHMVPNNIEIVENLPRTMTGKLDYKAMLSWPITFPSNGLSASQTQAEQSHTEQSVARTWQRVLGIDKNLSRDDDFFSVGGSSLQLVRARTQIRSLHKVDIALADMFAYPDVKGMAGLIDDKKFTRSPDDGTPMIRRVPEQETSNDGSTDVEGETERIDWAQETSLPDDWRWTSSLRPVAGSGVAMTGATSMIGAHLLAHLLHTTAATVYCLAVSIGTSNGDGSKAAVLKALNDWKLLDGLDQKRRDRIFAYGGSLAHSTLGLSSKTIKDLDHVVTDIYHLESDVSLLKRYDALRNTNVGSLRFLIQLAGGWIGNVKAIHYLSTWAVPHVQRWNATTRNPDIIDKSTQEMAHMLPGTAQNLGYLKVRWVGERLLGAAARRGIPVNVFRASMCAPGAASGCPLPRNDINRRILAGSLYTGLVPDFGSAEGGGMSWIDADFLVASMAYLSRRAPLPSAHASGSRLQIHHVTSSTHLTYAEVSEVLGHGVRVSTAEEWFSALRASDDLEMNMQAEVLEEWWRAGWLPFAIDNSETLRILADEAQIRPPAVTAKLLRRVVGDQGF